MKQTNMSLLKKIIISVIIIVASYFGYQFVVEETPKNVPVIENTVDSKDSTLSVDSTLINDSI